MTPLSSSGRGPAHVRLQGGVEQERVLGHIGDRRPPGTQIDLVERSAVDRDDSTVGVKEAEDDIGERGLPGAGRTDERGGRSSRNPQGDPADGRTAGLGVGEDDVS